MTDIAMKDIKNSTGDNESPLKISFLISTDPKVSPSNSRASGSLFHTLLQKSSNFFLTLLLSEDFLRFMNVVLDHTPCDSQSKL